ncbi:MAG: acyltransferase [Selenomonadaceae bacterium]|nr:acyltransferase [Selenomonadaceae bacterium]
MKKQISAITAMRGMGALGVIGIHVGGMYLNNPTPNLWLVALYDEASRYAVPIFFFLSAFGLFYKLDLKEKFDYIGMLRRRLKAVLLPYLTWSFFYLWHTSYWYDTPFPSDKLPETLIFGLAKYHIYFLVILIWFYLLMPLWVEIVKRLTEKWLILLLFIQIAVNYALCYSSNLYLFQTSLPEGSWLQLAIMHRLNYWVLFYFFTFLLGAYLAQRFDLFMWVLKEKYVKITIFFVVALAFQLGHYFYLINSGRTALEAIFTAHQLSPFGVLYTIASCLFFFWLFTYKLTSGRIYSTIETVGKHSYFIYLVHPLFLTIASLKFSLTGTVVTGGLSIGVYVGALICSLVFAVIFQKIAEFAPILGLLVLGKKR